MDAHDQFEGETLRTTFAGASVVIVAVGAWDAVTWERPHRGVILTLVGLALMLTLGLARVPADRLL